MSATTSTPSAIPSVTDATFDELVVGAPGVAVVKFTAAWCPPCHVIAPWVSALATEYAGRAAFYELDNDANSRSAARFGVRGLPTLVYFRDGVEAGRVIGAAPKEQLRAQLEKLLG